MDFISCTSYFVLLFIFIYIMKPIWEEKPTQKTPPGPYSLPFFGNIFHIGFRRLHEVFTEFSKQYGDVFMIDLLGLRYVVVNNAGIAREALLTRKDDFAGRPSPPPYVASLLTGNCNDIVMADFGAELMLKRKVVHSAMRMYGENLRHMEEKIGYEIHCLTQAIKGRAGEPFDPKNDVCLAVLNTIFAIVFNDRYNIDDPEFLKMAELTEFFNKMCFPGNLINLMPWLRVFPLPSSKKLREGILYRDGVYKRRYMEHKSTFDPNNSRDLTDALIKTFIEENTAKRRDNGLTVTEHDLLLIINDVFVAGFETQTTTLSWFLLYMITYPNIQAKAQEEMDRVVGRNRLPCLKDRDHLPYTSALVAEVLRFSSVLPVSIPKKAIRDSKLGGYDIPKGTGLIVNLWALHHDNREWDEPHKFDPSHFLDASGGFVGYGFQSFLPFGAGRRVCLGESLAKIELFLFVSRLLHTFQFKIGPTKVDLETEYFYSNSPMPYQLQAFPRS